MMNTLVCASKYKNKESMKLYKNIDVVQINVKAGVSEYFLPKNVDWADQVVDKIVVYAPEQDAGELSPVDMSTPILDRMLYQNAYFDLYAADNTELAHSLSAQSVVHVNNYPLEINSKLSLQLSRIFFSKAPEQDGCLLLYIFYGTKDVEEDTPRNSVTVEVKAPMGKDVIFSEFIDRYIVAQNKKLRGIAIWPTIMTPDLFVTLRDRNYKTIVKHLPSEMCRSDLFSGVGGVENVQVYPMYFDAADVDFDNSFIRNTERVVYPEYGISFITLYY